MSCSRSADLAGQAAGKAGVSRLSSKSGYSSGSTAQVSFFDFQPATKTRAISKQEKKRSPEKKSTRNGKTGETSGQISFFDNAQTLANREKPHPKTKTRQMPLPTQRQIKISNDFSPEELQTISVQLRLGTAAVSRQIRELSGGASRGIGHSDPRPLDWARADKKNYQSLVSHLDAARHGTGYLDTSALNKDQLVDLWSFTRFEADRAMRNIDHLQSGQSHLKGPTAEYLIDRHRLEAKFYSFVAGQMEPMIPSEEFEAAKAWK